MNLLLPSSSPITIFSHFTYLFISMISQSRHIQSPETPRHGIPSLLSPPVQHV
ncbi:hypothetical protein B9Z19DRAFT_1084137 [Tuber borchii]|uniref:Uncharacterized protein n=1 Tax=Tuber borchii TaxID=42251 RepID=A0A2T6ZSG1_TUBBO|nr:hypothetical protein B9Z19DRAFT_1084137 [Tuber borchii]